MDDLADMYKTIWFTQLIRKANLTPTLTLTVKKKFTCGWVDMWKSSTAADSTATEPLTLYTWIQEIAEEIGTRNWN